MSKIESLKRYQTIISQLRTKKLNKEQLFEKIERVFEIDGYNFSRCSRTLKRDFEDIYTLYKIEINYDFRQKVYYIENEHFDKEQLILESLDIVHALQTGSNLLQYIHFDNRKPAGTQHLLPILQAIRKQKIIKIQHQKFRDKEPIIRYIKPLSLKEAQRRWYIVAREKGKEAIKTFGLDRIEWIETTNMKFEYPTDFNVDDFFKNCFGVITPDIDDTIAKITLSFNPDQRKYLETMPLHATQKVLIDNSEEYRIALEIYPTYDFIREIRSYGKAVKVIEPENLLLE